jgi:hypothetical protein
MPAVVENRVQRRIKRDLKDAKVNKIHAGLCKNTAAARAL